MKTKWEAFLTREIAIEYKTSIYVFCLYFFYGCYQLFSGLASMRILVMVEMVAAAYTITYVQVCVFHNFDEGDKLTASVWLGLLVCSVLYGATAHWLRWFDGKWLISLFLFIYIAGVYLLIFTANKIKRKIDSKQLNRQLEHFKKRKETNHD